MSGLSVRTIQRIEKGEKAGLESLKIIKPLFLRPILKILIKKKKPNKLEKKKLTFGKLKGFYKLPRSCYCESNFLLF